MAASEFGLTPSSRSRIVAGNGKAKETEDEMEALLGDSGVFGQTVGKNQGGVMGDGA